VQCWQHLGRAYCDTRFGLPSKQTSRVDGWLLLCGRVDSLTLLIDSIQFVALWVESNESRTFQYGFLRPQSYLRIGRVSNQKSLIVARYANLNAHDEFRLALDSRWPLLHTGQPDVSTLRIVHNNYKHSQACYLAIIDQPRQSARSY